MKAGIFLGLLVASQVSASSLAGTQPSTSFAINGINIGQTIGNAREVLPALKCENSCVAENQLFFGKRGTFWAGLEDGKIAQLAFRFKPALTDGSEENIRSFYIRKYGPAADNLGEEGCDEWRVQDGFLVICLTREVSHVWWSRKSRVDVNKSR